MGLMFFMGSLVFLACCFTLWVYYMMHKPENS